MVWSADEMRLPIQRAFLFGFACGLVTLYSLTFVLLGDQLSPINDVAHQCHHQVGNVQDLSETMRQGKPQRILCWISTSPKFKTRARLVKQTWGKRCDILLFMSTQADEELPTVVLTVPDDRPSLWGKSVQAWTHVYENYLDQADWFYKADDDSYAVMENMRRYLATFDPSLALYLGFTFKSEHMKDGFLSGGAGYVVTKETIKRFIELGMRGEKPLCNTDVQGADDWNVGLCMSKLKVTQFDTRDSEGKLRFMPWKLDNLLDKNGNANRGLSVHKYESGFNCCSSAPITFHYVRDNQPLVYEYFIYNLHKPVE